MENRDSFKSRLGFLLVSAGCAIGIGNVWNLRWLSPPLVPYGTTFPPLSGGTIKIRAAYPPSEPARKAQPFPGRTHRSVRST